MDDGDFVGDSEEENEGLRDAFQGNAAKDQAHAGRANAGGPHEQIEPPLAAEDWLDHLMPDVNYGVATSNDTINEEAVATPIGEKSGIGEERAPVVNHEVEDAGNARSDRNAAAEAPDDTAMIREKQSGPRPRFKVGDIVHVAARTWPGINKLGGAGKIASVTAETIEGGSFDFLYSVKYMLGGFEKRIEEEFVQELANALTNGARQHKERVFYHDEFAVDTQKKHKQLEQLHMPSSSSNEKTNTTTHADGSKRSRREECQKPILMDAPDIEYKDRSSDDSDYDGKDSHDEENQFHIRKLNDGSFILDERHAAASNRTTVKPHHAPSSLPKKKKKMKTKNNLNESGREEDRDAHKKKKTSRKQRKRAHRIIETDDESDSEAPDTSQALTPEKRKKKRRYVGGYVHGNGDLEGAFIQPEGNPTELPDDVAQELDFKLGKTKLDLRAQLDTVADRLVANLDEFAAKKAKLSRILDDSNILDQQGLQDANQSLLELGEFIRNKFIRSGEDVMNLIIKVLERKGGRLPDRIDLQFETWKRQVADHDMWVKQSLRALEGAFSRRGLRTSFVQEMGRSKISSDSDSSSPSDDEMSTGMIMSDEEFHFDRESAFTSRVQRNTKGRHYSDEYADAIPDEKLVHKPQHRSKKRPRSIMQTQSSLDEFTVPYDEARRRDMFEKPRAYTTSHFRLLGASKQKFLSDPKWDWVRKLKKSGANTRSTNHAGRKSRDTFTHLISSQDHMKGTRKSGSVMEALLKLRDKRYRQQYPHQTDHGRWKHGSSVIPRLEQKVDVVQVVRDTYQKISSSKGIVLAVRSNGNEVDVHDSLAVRHWPDVFAILPDEETIPSTIPTSTDHLMQLGRVLFRPSKVRGEDDFANERDGSCEEATIVNLLSRIRQQLVDLRFEERATMDAISLHDDKNADQSADMHLGVETMKWKSLCASGDEYHSALASLADEAEDIITNVSAGQALSLLRITITELKHLLSQIPDCHSVFGDSSSYPYFFEVVSPGAMTTPFITAICRTFWYIVQAVVTIKQVCEKRLTEARTDWEFLFTQVLPPNRVALACCLFLVDLYVRVPSTHRLTKEGEEAPALSLWMLLSTLFAEGALTSTTSRNNDDGFWAFLQTAYRQHFVDTAVMGFVMGDSSGGYVKDRPARPTSSQCSNEEVQGRLLAADAIWDLCGVLCLTFRSATHLPSSVWLSPQLVKELFERTASPPFPFFKAGNVFEDSELQLQLYGFKLRVMRRLLAMSSTVRLGSDVLDAFLPVALESRFDEDSDSTIASIVSFMSDLRASRSGKQNDPDLFELVRSHAVETTNPVALFCKIALVNLSMLEKSIHRTRFRQPILRSLSARLDSHVSLKASVSDSASVDEHSLKPATSWNWGGGGRIMDKQSKSHDRGNNTHDQKVANAPTPQLVISEAKAILPIYLMFALASIHLDGDSDEPDQRHRRQKELRREVEFFNKEFANAAREVPELAKCHCECILALGVSAIDSRASYSVAFEQLNCLLKSCAKELSLVHRNDLDNVKRKSSSSRSNLIAGAIQAGVQALRDLSAQLSHRMRVVRDIEEDEVEALKMCVASVMSDGISQCLELAADRVLPVPIIEVMVELLSTWLPREPDSPIRCLSVGPTLDSRPRDEFDEFDDEEMMGLLASVELDNPNSSNHHQVCQHIEEYSRDAAIVGIRVALQRLLISLPRKLWYSKEELYLLDFLGSMVSSCSFSFNWSVVTLVSLKQRMLAPRLMSSILKHRPDKEWLSTCFMSEQNADTELSSTWLSATLDLRALTPKRKELIPAGDHGSAKKPMEGGYSSYWMMLTDGIVTNILKENTIIRYKMDHLLYELLHTTAMNSSFREEVKLCSDPRDVETLYRMHIDVFWSFCRAAGGIWQRWMADPSRFRQEINRFRLKMMDKQRGVFLVLPQMYAVNLRAVCLDLDRKNVNWFSISSRFLDEFSSPSSQIGSLHAIDDATSILDRELADPAIRPIVVLFKFMYDCVDAFLFNCGGMAIGQQNIFFSIIELMFRQAKCAEFPTAERRLRRIRSSDHPLPVSVAPTEKVPAQSIPGVSPACAGFVESVRLFFAYQKYPSLINWFAQNLETYQTLRAGWSSSPLRVLLYNVLDPHGQLGIHSYYPMLADSTSGPRFEPSAIRREAFYLSCGLLHCRCTQSYEHSRQEPDYLQEERRMQLLDFILVDFVNELISSAEAECEDISESILPVLQFAKALLHHLNLNGQRCGTDGQYSISDAFISCLTVATRHISKILLVDNEVNESMSCVMLIEFLRIVEELVSLSNIVRDKRLSDFVAIGLRCAGLAYNSLRRFSSGALEEMFSPDCSDLDGLRRLIGQLQRYDGVEAAGDIKRELPDKSRFSQDDYGISRIRAQTDLLSSIRRLVKKCSEVEEVRGALQQVVLAKDSTCPTAISIDQGFEVGTT